MFAGRRLIVIESRSVLVSGGGIGGLTAALCLAATGYRVSIFEQAAKFDPIGAGIQLSPNALRILDQLGIGKTLRLSATTPQAIRILGAYRGKKLAEIPLGGEAIEQYGLPYLCINRSDLHSALLAACRDNSDITLFLGSTVKDCVEHQNGVSILVQHGTQVETHRGALFVCADGMKSKLRTDVFGEKPAFHTGYQAWRAMVPVENIPAAYPAEYSHLIWARGAHAIFYPVHAGRYVNIVIVTKAKDTALENTVAAATADLHKMTRFWARDLKALISATGNWSIWPILETRHTGPWYRNSMVMIGDAAHGMPPYAAQGAAMAIEDAKILADCLARSTGNLGDQEALKQFYSSRKQRIRKLAKLATANREIYHMGFPFSTARNIGLKLIPAKKLLARQSWIYDWKA